MSRKPSFKQRLDALVREMRDKGIRLDEAADALECRYLEQALRECGGNQSRAAATLRIHRNTLRRKLARHGLD